MRLTIFALTVGLAALPAFAFQETTVGSGQGDAPAAAAAPIPVVPPQGLDVLPKSETGKALQLQVPGVSFGARPGTEVKIPGLGTVGVLPKLDFGLELLYGATDSKTAVPESKPDPNDVQIRGTLKHRF